jgi:hypothetical protein
MLRRLAMSFVLCFLQSVRTQGTCNCPASGCGKALLSYTPEVKLFILNVMSTQRLDAYTGGGDKMLIEAEKYNEYNRTLAEVGTELGLSKSRIRQIEKEVLAKLRHSSHSRELIGYLG